MIEEPRLRLKKQRASLQRMATFDPRQHEPQYGGLKARLRPQSHAKHGLR